MMKDEIRREVEAVIGRWDQLNHQVKNESHKLL